MQIFTDYVGYPVGNSRIMQVFGVMQVCQQGIPKTHIMQVFGITQVSNRELANYLGYISKNYIVCPVGNSRIMQVYGIMQVIQQGIRELCRFPGVVQVFQQGIRELCRFFEIMQASNRALTNYIGSQNYIVFPLGNSRIISRVMQVFGIMQVSNRECRFLGLCGFSTQGIRALCRCLELCRLPIMEFASYVGCWN